MSKENIDDGGNAFPLSITTMFESRTCETKSKGMTLRDYFAAKAMQSMLSNQQMYDCINDNCVKLLAMDSFIVADAMLKARNQK